MTDWTAVRTHVRSRFSVESEHNDAIVLSWTLDGGEQKQWVQRVKAFGMPHLLIVCPVCEDHELPARDALRHNHALAAGFLALDRHGYVMRGLVAMDALSFTALDRMLEMMAHEAARIRTNVQRARAA